MSLIDIMDPGDGGPFHLTYRVSAPDRDAAMDQAKTLCRADGYAIRTAGGVTDLGDSVYGANANDHDWDVILVARPRA